MDKMSGPNFYIRLFSIDFNNNSPGIGSGTIRLSDEVCIVDTLQHVVYLNKIRIAQLGL